MPTVLLTGAGRGLGLEFTRQYSADGWSVLACVRSPGKAAELQQLASVSGGRIAIHTLDVTDFAAVDTLARELNARTLDVLINCAGSMGRTTAFGATNYAEMEQIFRLNAYAPLKVSEAFVQHVARSEQKKIVNLSTLMASIAQNELGNFYAYRGSKAALNAFSKSMAIDLGRKHGIIVGMLHPGWVRTDMGGPRAELLPPDSVAGMRRVIAGLTKEQSGRFWSYTGEEIPW
jgi:NAD(P)-dependent dehydrogenase (short-subunit alcohol dehydrogenase family)